MGGLRLPLFWGIMDQDTITKLTRRGIREFKPKDISDDEIEVMTLQGVNIFGMQIKQNDPSFYNKRASISSNTHVFSKPSDCDSILRIWDMKTTALTVSGAADNGSGLVRITTSAAHGLSDGAIIFVHGVGGTTEANGTWQIDYDSTTMATTVFDLVGSTFTNTFVSAGYAFQDVDYADRIDKKQLRDADLSSPNRWYPRSDEIVIDDDNFTNDIIIDYVKTPSAITDIPAVYHLGLVAFNVIALIRIPDQTDPKYADMTASYQTNLGMFERMKLEIDKTFRVSTEPNEIAEGMNLDDYL